MRIDIRGSRELQDVALALRDVDKTLAKEIRSRTRQLTGPEFKEAIAGNASTALEQRVIAATATAAATNNNVRLSAARKGRRLSGGLSPKTDWAAVELGARPKKTTYTRKGHNVTRTVNTGFKSRRPRGYVFFPTVAEIAPRIVALWVQTAVRTLWEASEGKR